MRSNKSLKSSSLPRWSSDASVKRSSLVLIAMKISNTRVSRWTVSSGAEEVVADDIGNGSEE